MSPQQGNDTVYGGGGEDSIGGYDGEDHVYGGAGDDYLEGGVGDDHVYGGAGDDYLYEMGYGIEPADVDIIYDSSGDDTVETLDGDSLDTLCTNDGEKFDYADPGDLINDRDLCTEL